MMKFVYIALILILAILICIYGVLLLSYRPPVVDKSMTVLTNSLVSNSPALDIGSLAAGNENFKPSMPSNIWKSNLFDPSRGVSGIAGSISSSGGLKNVELVGIFNDGSVKGAVILIKSGESGSSGGYGGSSGYGSSGSQQKQLPVKQKTVFKVGDRLPNGVVLESVGNDFVMLHAGEESIKLEMTFFDDNSAKRIAEATKAGTKQQSQITIISGQGGTSPSGGQSGASGPTVITSGNPQSQGVFQGYGR